MKNNSIKQIGESSIHAFITNRFGQEINPGNPTYSDKSSADFTHSYDVYATGQWEHLQYDIHFIGCCHLVWIAFTVINTFYYSYEEI